MAHIFNYAVLMATPDPSRGERVNVGLAVFLNDRVDVRFAELAKVRALTGTDWSAYAKDFERRLTERFSTGTAAKEHLSSALGFDAVIRTSDVATFSIKSVDEYESRVREVLGALVVRPKLEAERTRSTRINTEIAKQLRTVQALASQEESIDSHKVVRDYFVEDDLRADFAQRNGVMRVATTLDLRRPHVDIKEATLKAIVLDRAHEVYGKGTLRWGVCAVAPQEADHFRSHLKLLHEYSDRVFNWEIPNERREFVRNVQAGMAVPGPLL